MLSKKKINKPTVLGKIGSSHGIYGWNKLLSFAEIDESIFNYYPWFIKEQNLLKRIELERWKRHKKKLLIKLKGINCRNKSDLLVNKKIFSSLLKLPVLEKGDFYWKDILSCKVITIKGKLLGIVTNIIDTGSNDVLVITLNRENIKPAIKQCLIPFLDKKVIKEIDIAANIIKVDWNDSFEFF